MKKRIKYSWSLSQWKIHRSSLDPAAGIPHISRTNYAAIRIFYVKGAVWETMGQLIMKIKKK